MLDSMNSMCCSGNVGMLFFCETFYVGQIEMSNDELYSSSVRQFSVSVSDRYPTRDWRTVASFTAAEKRGLQTFNITSNVTSKFLRVMPQFLPLNSDVVTSSSVDYTVFAVI